MRMIDGLVQALDRREGHPGRILRPHLEAEARALLEDNTALLSLQTGEIAPDFSLPDTSGHLVQLSDLLVRGPVVVTFYRGGWCPHCGGYLRDLERAIDEFYSAGINVLAISPQNQAHSAETAERLDLSFTVLSDAENAVARQFGLVFQLPESFRRAYEVLGINLPVFNDSTRFELPIPATYVIDTDRTIAYAVVDPDYTRRPDPREILSAIDRLQAG